MSHKRKQKQPSGQADDASVAGNSVAAAAAAVASVATTGMWSLWLKTSTAWHYCCC
jgi:hypothetical protein